MNFDCINKCSNYARIEKLLTSEYCSIGQKSAFRRCTGTAWKLATLGAISPHRCMKFVLLLAKITYNCHLLSNQDSDSLQLARGHLSHPWTTRPRPSPGSGRPLGSALRVGCEYLKGQLAVPGFIFFFLCLSGLPYNPVLESFLFSVPGPCTLKLAEQSPFMLQNLLFTVTDTAEEGFLFRLLYLFIYCLSQQLLYNGYSYSCLSPSAHYSRAGALEKYSNVIMCQMSVKRWK